MPVSVSIFTVDFQVSFPEHHELPSPSPFLLCVAGTASTHFSKMSILLKEPDLWNASKNWIQLQKQILQEDAAGCLGRMPQRAWKWKPIFYWKMKTDLQIRRWSHFDDDHGDNDNDQETPRSFCVISWLVFFTNKLATNWKTTVYDQPIAISGLMIQYHR